MSNVISLQERQFAARISDLLYFAYESGSTHLIKLTAQLATKAVEQGVTADEIAEVEKCVRSM